ncbi:MAG TPA: sulfotransferase [Anaerolineales bacterium]|jgi:hypothetical protein|nr:sulfotransferase [Anaerolineales bacterium]
MRQSFISGIYSSLTRTDSRTANQSLLEQARAKARLLKSYINSYLWARQKAERFQDVQHYCLFVGHARSGGSLLGGLVDAHPNAVIADEVDIFPYLEAGFEREQVFHILLERSQHQAKQGRSKAGREAQHMFSVPGQWQGRYQTLQVIGNRKAGISTQHLRQNPNSYSQLRRFLGEMTNLKVIFSVRNPFDTVSTMNIRSGRELVNGIDVYFSNCETIEVLRKDLPSTDFLAVRHEALLQNPANELQQMCQFLGLPALPDYIQACASILYRTPSRSRNKVDWSPELIESVKARIGQYEFLQGYSFEN